MFSVHKGAVAAVIYCTCSLTKKDCFLLLHLPISPSLIQQCSVTWGRRMQVMREDCPLWSEEVLFFFSWNPVAALSSLFWQLHFHPVYLLFVRADVLGRSCMSCGFSLRGHHPWLCYAKDHVRNCGPLQKKVSRPNLSHIPQQSKQSWLLCAEMNQDLSNGPLFGSSMGAVSPEEKMVAGNFWTE